MCLAPQNLDPSIPYLTFQKTFPKSYSFSETGCLWAAYPSRRPPWNTLSGGECLFHDFTLESEPGIICCKLPDHSSSKSIQTPPPRFESHAKWFFYRSLWLLPTVFAGTFQHSDCSLVSLRLLSGKISLISSPFHHECPWISEHHSFFHAYKLVSTSL